MTEKLTSKEKIIVAGVISFLAIAVGFASYLAINHPFLSILLFSVNL